MQNSKKHYIYNPQQMTDEESKELFYIRKDELNKLLEYINDYKNSFVKGQRGAGKTTLFRRAVAELRDRKDLLIIQFPEEQYGIFELCRFWESVAEIIEDFYDIDGEITEGFEDIFNSENYDSECFSVLESWLKSKDRKAIIFLDNLSDLLERFTEIEINRFNQLFSDSEYVTLIASTSKEVERQPLFQEEIRLEGLNKEETIELLKSLSKELNVSDDFISKKSAEIETIRRLTGGVPRTVVIFFEILQDSDGTAFEHLEEILDRVTPLYKHRMDDLPKQQQAIVNVLALNWDGMVAKEIVDKLKNRGYDTKKVSAQLKVLEKSEMVESRMINRKDKVYLIKERFFNIWYLMRYGKKSSRRDVKWLVNFLKEWLSPDEVNARAKGIISVLKNGNYSKRGMLLQTKAISELIEDELLQDELLRTAKDSLDTQDIRKSDLELAEKLDNFIIQQDWKSVLQTIDKLSPYLKEKSIVLSVVGKAMNNLAVLYYEESKDIDSAIKYYKMAIDSGYSNAMFNLAVLYYEESKDIDSAIKYYKMAINSGDSKAMHNLAILYYKEFQDIDSAIKYHKMAIDSGEKRAIKNYILVLLFSKQYTKALKFFDDNKLLKREYKSFYYALITLIQDRDSKYSLELKKMGSELQETVNEVLDYVKQEQKALENSRKGF
jgi:tetratricopeptide (TPR) repeat protein